VSTYVALYSYLDRCTGYPYREIRLSASRVPSLISLSTVERQRAIAVLVPVGDYVAATCPVSIHSNFYYSDIEFYVQSGSEAYVRIRTSLSLYRRRRVGPQAARRTVLVPVVRRASRKASCNCTYVQF
jgi:hypothetical protein